MRAWRDPHGQQTDGDIVVDKVETRWTLVIFPCDSPTTWRRSPADSGPRAVVEQQTRRSDDLEGRARNRRVEIVVGKGA